MLCFSVVGEHVLNQISLNVYNSIRFNVSLFAFMALESSIAVFLIIAQIAFSDNCYKIHANLYNKYRLLTKSSFSDNFLC